jgi:hypothetical protein
VATPIQLAVISTDFMGLPSKRKLVSGAAEGKDHIAMAAELPERSAQQWPLQKAELPKQHLFLLSALHLSRRKVAEIPV